MRNLKYLFIGILTLWVGTMSAQSAALNVALKFQIGNPGSTGTNPTFTVSGFVSDDLGRWDATNVQVGDSLYAINGSDLAVCVVTTINSAGGNSLNITVTCGDPLVGGIDAGQAAIVHPTSEFKYPTYIAGLRDDLRSMIMNRLTQRIDENIRNAQEVALTIGAGIPASTVATVQGYRLAKTNMGDGDLYEWNGTSWVLVGGSSTTFNDTPTIDFSGTSTVTADVKPNSLDSSFIKDKTIRLLELNQSGATTGQVPVWDGSKWGPGTVSVSVIDSLGLWTFPENMKTTTSSVLESVAGNKNTNIVLLGDSKTDQSIIMERSFKQVLGEKFFFSGPGFVPISNLIDQFTGTTNSTWTLKTMLTGGEGPNMFSLQSGPSSSAINLYPYFASKSYYKFNRAKIIYIGKSGGGTFTLDINGVSTSINTSLTTGPQTAFVDATTISNHTITITQTAYNTSGVELVGVILENSTQNGVRVHKVGQANATTTNYIGQDSINFVNQLKMLSPDAYFVWLGTNDKTQSIPPATYKSNVKGLVRRLKATNGIADICLLGVGPKSVPPWTDGIYTYEQYNNVLKEVAKEDTLSFFNTLKLEGIYSEANQRGLFQLDGLHEDTLGGMIITNHLLNAIPAISGAKQSDLLLVTKDSPVQHPQVFSYFDFGSRRTSSVETDFFVEGHTAPNIPNGTFMKQFIGKNNTGNNGFTTIFEYITSGNALNSYSIKSIGSNLGIKFTAAGNFTADASVTGTRLNFNGGFSNTAGIWNGTGTVRALASSGDFTSFFIGRLCGPSSDAQMTGTRNLGYGFSCLSSITTGSRNVSIGPGASEYLTTTNGSISIGNFANRLTQNLGYDYSKCIAIGDSVLHNPSYNPGNKLVLENSPSNTPLLSGDFGTNKIGINVPQSAPRTTLDIRGTDAITIPSGTTAQRITGAVGDIRVNTTTGNFEGVRTGTTYENFQMGMTVQGTLDYPSISPQTSVTLTITVVGATTQDFALVQPVSGVTANMIPTAWVSGPDTVTVSMYNSNVTAIDLPSQTFNVKVIKN